MEPIHALATSRLLLARLLSISACFILFQYESVEEIISQVFEEFNFFQESGLLQFWKCTESPDSEDSGCNLLLLDKPFRLTDRNHEGLMNYRSKSHDNVIRFVGALKKVSKNWFAGRAAQTGIADHRTKDLVCSDHYQQQYAEATGMGQCVLPVFYDVGDEKKLAGIIELVTSIPKESYVDDFNQLSHLLQGKGLKSSYMGKTIKIQHDGHTIKFHLSISAEFTDLLKEVTNRFQELKNKRVCIKYKDHRISNDEDLQKCMKEFGSNGEAFIGMFVEHVDGVPLFSVLASCFACSRVYVGDSFGDHTVSSTGIKHLHNVVQDTLVDVCYKSGISARKEVDIGLSRGNDGALRPANVLLYSWRRGQDVCVDLTWSFVLTQSGLASFVLERVVADAANRKRMKYKATC